MKMILKKIGVITLFSISLFLFSFSKDVAAATYYWVGGTTDSNTSNLDNWNTTPGACADSGNLVAPGVADTVVFTGNCLNGATIDVDLSVDNYNMSDDYTGTVSLDTTDLSVATQIKIDGGTLQVINGGTVAAPSGTGGIIIGDSGISDGTLIVDGSDSSLTQTISGTTRIRIGNSDGSTGSLIVRNGATVNTGNVYGGYASGSTANITIDGAGTVWNSDVDSGLGYIGRNGDATLVISDGAVVNSGAGPWQIGGNAGSSANVTITGSGSQLNFTNPNCNLRIAYGGTATVIVEDSATLVSGKITVADQVGSVGTLTIGSGYNVDVITTTLGINTGSGTASVPPEATASIVATPRSSSIVWDWEDIVGVTAYNVYYEGTLLTSISSGASSWIQDSLSRGVLYDVYIRGVNAQGEGAVTIGSASTLDTSSKSKRRRESVTEEPKVTTLDVIDEDVDDLIIINEPDVEVRKQVKVLLQQLLGLLKGQLEDLLEKKRGLN